MAGIDDAQDPAAILRPLRRVRQVREYTAEVPSDAALDALADVGRWSGSSRNEQPWRFLILRDQPVLRRIWEIGVPQTRALATATAAIAIVLPVREHEIGDAYDDGRAADRLLIGASYLGLGAAIQWIWTTSRRSASCSACCPTGSCVDHRAGLSVRGRPPAEGGARRGTAAARRGDLPRALAGVAAAAPRAGPSPAPGPPHPANRRPHIRGTSSGAGSDIAHRGFGPIRRDARRPTARICAPRTSLVPAPAA